MNRTLSVATDFSRHPAGRTPADGENSGERLRNLIIQHLDKLTGDDKLIIDLKGTNGYSAAFLEEAFGGVNSRNWNGLLHFF